MLHFRVIAISMVNVLHILARIGVGLHRIEFSRRVGDVKACIYICT